MATNAIPEGIEDNLIDYYDIMVIGRTGMGKSTTSDKLIMADLDGHNCHQGGQLMYQCRPIASGRAGRVWARALSVSH